jgi:arginyl-tRNA synthetase
VVALQAGDEQTRTIWLRLVDVSIDAFDATYRRLDIRLTRADVMGESAYNDDLPALVDELTAAGMLTESDGASCVFNPGFLGRDGQPLPVIVRKRDGGFGYSATDLAAIRHRVATLAADRLIYVVDVRQSLHFEQVLAVARRAGWLPEPVNAEHVHFGSVLDENGQPFKSRDGQIASLRSLLDIAEQEAAALLADRNSIDRDLAGRDSIDRDLADGGSTARGSGGAELARAIGLGAIKYADLSAGRSRDYVFAVHRMVALDGNTGPYLQYAHARLCSLLRRGGTGPWTVTVLSEPAEQQLAFVLTRFPAAVAETLQTLEPHRLCGYLYRLASTFSAFYQSCPVTQDGVPPQTRDSRLALCGVARRTLALGLDLLGIAAPESM